MRNCPDRETCTAGSEPFTYDFPARRRRKTAKTPRKSGLGPRKELVQKGRFDPSLTRFAPGLTAPPPRPIRRPRSAITSCRIESCGETGRLDRRAAPAPIHQGRSDLPQPVCRRALVAILCGNFHRISNEPSARSLAPPPARPAHLPNHRTGLPGEPPPPRRTPSPTPSYRPACAPGVRHACQTPRQPARHRAKKPRLLGIRCFRSVLSHPGLRRHPPTGKSGPSPVAPSSSPFNNGLRGGPLRLKSARSRGRC